MRKKINVLRIRMRTRNLGELLKTLVVLFIIIVFYGCSKDLSEVEPGQNHIKANSVLKANDSVSLKYAIVAEALFTGNTAYAIIAQMGTGFNLGNTFDMAQYSTDPTNIKPIIDLYYNVGMRHIRIPVTWMDGFNGNHLADVNGNINYQHPRFLQLVQVIEYAIQKGFIVVLNTHHEHWLKNNYDGSATYNIKFSNLWKGIANYFINHSDRLVFEILNEPEGKFGSWSGTVNPQDPVAIALTRQIMKVGYDAIRTTGGGNSTRIIMVSPNAQGNSWSIDEVYPTAAALPGGGADSYVAIQVHSYDPWNFCGQTGSNRNYPGAQSLKDGINTCVAHAAILGVPINYGEFGVGRSRKPTERNTDIVREYYRVMRFELVTQNMAATVWDDRGWFGLVTANVPYSFVYNIVPNMMKP